MNDSSPSRAQILRSGGIFLGVTGLLIGIPAALKVLNFSTFTIVFISMATIIVPLAYVVAIYGRSERKPIAHRRVRLVTLAFYVILGSVLTVILAVMAQKWASLFAGSLTVMCMGYFSALRRSP